MTKKELVKRLDSIYGDVESLEDEPIITAPKYIKKLNERIQDLVAEIEDKEFVLELEGSRGDEETR